MGVGQLVPKVKTLGGGANTPPSAPMLALWGGRAFSAATPPTPL